MWRTLLLVASAATPGAAQETADPRPPSNDRVVEEILVLGEIPGPPIWKVTNDDHVLWMLGYPEWVPDSLFWQRSDFVEFVEHMLANSDEYLTSVGVRVTTANPFRQRQFRRIQRIPDRGTLEDLLPEDLYQLYLETQLRYAPTRDDIERLTPGFAAMELFDSAAQSAGFERGSRTIRRAMEKRARKHGLKELTAVISQRPQELLDSIEGMSADAGQTCLQARLQGLDAQLEALAHLAAAWAEGDLATLRSHPGDSAAGACDPRRLASDPEELIQAKSLSWALWHDNADHALSNNASTFAIVPLRDLLRRDGHLSRLRQSGYEIRVL